MKSRSSTKKIKRGWNSLQDMVADILRALETFRDLSPRVRLERAARRIGNGGRIDKVDRQFIASALWKLAKLEPSGDRTSRSALADHLARALRIPRAQAGAFVVQSKKEIPAMVRAVGRLRSARGGKSRK